MDDELENLKLDVSTWKIRQTHRTRGSMKLQINLSKDEAIAFKNFAEAIKPEEISQDQFLKSVFITGIQTLSTELTNAVKTYAKENKEDLAASGITVIEGEDGNIELSANENLPGLDEDTITKYEE
jgi:hypothetical protein